MGRESRSQQMEGVVVINTYLATSKEFQPIIVTKTVDGVPTRVTLGVQYVLVPKGTPLSQGEPKVPDVLEDEIGFFTNQLAPGYWEVGARILSNPEQPFISCGLIRIK